jgi:hypothetical protein
LDLRYRPLAGKDGGLSASVTVTFAAPGHPTLRQSVPVTFIDTAKHATRVSKSVRHGSRRRARGSGR